jgi:hypothetical protein
MLTRESPICQLSPDACSQNVGTKLAHFIRAACQPIFVRGPRARDPGSSMSARLDPGLSGPRSRSENGDSSMNEKCRQQLLQMIIGSLSNPLAH